MCLVLFATVPVNLIHGHCDIVQSGYVSYCSTKQRYKKITHPISLSNSNFKSQNVIKKMFLNFYVIYVVR